MERENPAHRHVRIVAEISDRATLVMGNLETLRLPDGLRSPPQTSVRALRDAVWWASQALVSHLAMVEAARSHRSCPLIVQSELAEHRGFAVACWLRCVRSIARLQGADVRALLTSDGPLAVGPLACVAATEDPCWAAAVAADDGTGTHSAVSALGALYRLAELVGGSTMPVRLALRLVANTGAAIAPSLDSATFPDGAPVDD
jgi:hypothetical protein